MNNTLNGKWLYRSYRHEPITVTGGKVEGTPNLAIPWGILGTLEVTTDSDGKVRGELTFAPGLALKFTGTITPATDKQPAALEAVGEVRTSVNRLKGFFIPGGNCVVGTILCEANDPAGQPVGTAGSFVLTAVEVSPSPALPAARAKS